MTNIMFFNDAAQTVRAYIPRFSEMDAAMQCDAAHERLVDMDLAGEWQWIEVFTCN